MDQKPWFRLTLAVLATWRVTHLLAQEDGPGDVIATLRQWLGSGFFGELMDCFYCLSVWISIPFAFFIADWMLDRFVVWLALSGAASLANKFTPEPVIFEPLDGKDH